jgi:hypothetical protein
LLFKTCSWSSLWLDHPHHPVLICTFCANEDFEGSSTTHREKKKGKGKKGSGGNNKKLDKNVEGAKDEKRKVKFPCNICEEYHLTHQFPRMEEAQHLIKLNQQQCSMLKNPISTRE